MEKLLMSLEAVCSILTECYSISGTETGGVLVGPKNHKRIITDIIPSSAHAERGRYTYYQSEKDVEILNSELRSFQGTGMDYKGDFHKHPSGYHVLSPEDGDMKTCAEILQNSNYKINNYLLMLIITEKPELSSIPIFAYSVSLDKQRNVIVKEMSINVLPKSCIEECMDCFLDEPVQEPIQDGGEDYESDDTGHSNERDEETEPSDTVRDQEETEGDDNVAEEDRSVLQGRGFPQGFKRSKSRRNNSSFTGRRKTKVRKQKGRDK